MPVLADVQALVHRAVVGGDLSPMARLLTGGGDPVRRLAIHQRHYATSLTTAILNRFPATVWLVGSDLVIAAARAFVIDHPPTRPCIAEYGDAFPAYLAAMPASAQLPYVESFARLEWHVGRLALAVEHPALGDDPHPGVEYLHLSWPVDTLMSVFLTGIEPEQFELRPKDVWLEVRGTRGDLRMTRLTREDFNDARRPA